MERAQDNNTDEGMKRDEGERKKGTQVIMKGYEEKEKRKWSGLKYLR